MDPHRMATILREYEGYCYQITYYLLQKENCAVTATKKALLELARTPCFLTESATERRQHAKRIAIKHAITFVCSAETKGASVGYSASSPECIAMS